MSAQQVRFKFGSLVREEVFLSSLAGKVEMDNIPKSVRPALYKLLLPSLGCLILGMRCKMEEWEYE